LNKYKEGFVPIIHVPIINMFKLRTKPTQFTIGKTEDTLCDLTQRYLLNNADDSDYHLIDIIVTNKSLPETEQWKCRTDKSFQKYNNITIDILSSKSNDYNNVSSYIHNIFTCKTKDELPNILIICYHAKRVCEDLITLFGIFGGENYFKPENKIKFHVSFDEPDANLGVTKTFIRKVKKYIDIQVIIGILFITATPIDKFWEMLNNSGIKTLLNMNYNNTQNFDEEFQNYRSFNDHNIIIHENETTNPLYYIIDIFSKNRITLQNKETLENTTLHLTPEQEEHHIDLSKYDIVNKTKIINETERKIIFAPAHLYTDATGVGSHMEIVSYFNDKNYCAFLMNGKFKGFIYPDKSRVELIHFNAEHNIKGELRESLVKWNELNPTMNLVITGYWIVERGITFNTIGFNFTDMILSNYHLSSIGKLIQLAGRGSGGKKYVDNMNVICTKEIKDTIDAFNKRLRDICSLNPEHFNKTDFADNKNAIPVKMIIEDNDLLKLILEIRDTTKKYKQPLHNKIVEGIQDKKITIIDKNNLKKFDITKRGINQVRMYKVGDKIEDRRFKNFNDAFENYKNVAQSGDETQYNIDFAKDEYVYDDFVNPCNIAWITYKF
jgi:hypothetical protein